MEDEKRFIEEKHDVTWRKGVDKPILLGSITIKLPTALSAYCERGSAQYDALAEIGFRTWRSRQITNAQDEARLRLGAEKGLVEAKPGSEDRLMVKSILAKAKAKGLTQDALEKFLSTLLA